MPERIFKRVEERLKYWYLPLIAGLILIAIGIWTFSNKLETFAALAFLFSLSFVFSGLMETGYALFNRHRMDGWGWSLAMGLLTFMVGILLFARPGISMVTLTFFIGFVVLFRSMNAISMAMHLRNFGASYGGLLLMGILGMIFGFILLWDPKLAGLSVVIYTGIALIIAGLFNVLISLILKKLHTYSGEISQELMDRYKAVQKEIEEEMNN